jgi:uncharacterized protein YegJ (DUF2314 family)
MNLFRKLFGKNKQDTPVTRREDNPDVYHISGEEERMNFAIEKARHTLRYFKESLHNNQPGQEYFSLKAKIIDGNEIEHIWLNNVSFDESNTFYGSIGNQPLNVKNVSMGQEVGVGIENVSDWMILENGKLIGGYTIRAIRDGKKGKELEKFDQSIGLFIDEGVDYYEHDFSTPEGALLCLEDAYDDQDIDKIISCKDFEEEARLMISSMDNLKKFSDDKEIIMSTAETLRLSLIKHLMENGFPSFKDVKRAFPKREYINPDLLILTEVCIYPDNTKSATKLYISRKNEQWKVLNPA